MSVAERVIALIEQLTKSGDSEIVRGPLHPSNPNPQLLPRLDDLIKKAPFVSKDQGYLTFLEVYWEASFWNRVTNTVTHIYTCVDVGDAKDIEGEMLEHLANNHYSFATATRYYKHEDARMPNEPSYFINMFSFADGSEKSVEIVCVSCADNSEPSGEMVCCRSFVEWLEGIVENGGLLIDNRVE